MRAYALIDPAPSVMLGRLDTLVNSLGVPEQIVTVIYGVGTSVVTGSGAPTASMVYKLVEVDGMPVEKRSSHKESHGGRKQAHRLAKPSGTIVEEIVHPAGEPPAA